MGKETGIDWTHHTFNGWWGCQEVSPECAHCYARSLAERWGFHIWGGTESPRRLFGDKHWNEPRKWNAQAKAEGRRHRVFAFSMADVFEFHPQLVEPRKRFLALAEELDWLDWQVLTKRPENIGDMVPQHWLDGLWPDNVWIGTSAGKQDQAALRMVWLYDLHQLVKRPPVIFVSAEPLLGEVRLTRLELLEEPRVAQLLRGTMDKREAALWAKIWRKKAEAIVASVGEPDGTWNALAQGLIDWRIDGGESGPRHRPANLDWFRVGRDECLTYDVAYFLKQIGGQTPKANGKVLDGMTWCEFPGLGVA